MHYLKIQRRTISYILFVIYIALFSFCWWASDIQHQLIYPLHDKSGIFLPNHCYSSRHLQWQHNLPIFSPDHWYARQEIGNSHCTLWPYNSYAANEVRWHEVNVPSVQYCPVTIRQEWKNMSLFLNILELLLEIVHMYIHVYRY